MRSFYYMTSKKLNLAIMLDDDLLLSLSEGLLLVKPLECLQVHWQDYLLVQVLAYRG